MLFVPASITPVNCVLVSTVVWLNGSFWKNCSTVPATPWSESASEEFYNLTQQIQFPYNPIVYKLDTKLTPEESAVAGPIFSAFLLNQVIVVPSYCSVPDYVVKDWSESPYTLASAVIHHKPISLYRPVEQSYALLALLGPLALAILLLRAQRRERAFATKQT